MMPDCRTHRGPFFPTLTDWHANTHSLYVSSESCRLLRMANLAVTSAKFESPQVRDHRIGEFAGGRAPAHVRRQMLLLRIDALDGAAQAGGSGYFAQMNQHERRRQHQGGGICDAFSCDVGSAAMDGFKHRERVAHVRAGY